jgi:hypothetical protein
MIGIVLSLESLPKVATLPVDWISKECHDKRQKRCLLLWLAEELRLRSEGHDRAFLLRIFVQGRTPPLSSQFFLRRSISIFVTCRGEMHSLLIYCTVC